MRTDPTHPPLTFYPPFLFTWVTVQFPDRGLHVFVKERAPGKLSTCRASRRSASIDAPTRPAVDGSATRHRMGGRPTRPDGAGGALRP